MKNSLFFTVIDFNEDSRIYFHDLTYKANKKTSPDFWGRFSEINMC